MSETNDFVPNGLPASSGPAPRRGRPTNAEIAARNAEAPQAQPARVAAEQKSRRRRADTSETRNMKLRFPEELKHPDFVYRYFNDTEDGRIHDKTVNDDWEKVTLRGQDQEDVPVVRNAGHGLKTHLLRKPRKYHEEDKAKSLESITTIEKAMERGEQVTAGGLDKAVSYVPGGGNSISRGR